ncbi:MAG: hypothetical protein KDE63_05740 [Novosphingobium sp.]|nr:hypothetical protein [Novosphingobium sp.]
MRALTWKKALKQRMAQLEKSESKSDLAQHALACDAFARADPAQLLVAIGDDLISLSAALVPCFMPDETGKAGCAPTMTNWMIGVWEVLVRYPMQKTSQLLVNCAARLGQVPAPDTLLVSAWGLALPALSQMHASGAGIITRDHDQWVIEDPAGRPDEHIMIRMYYLTMQTAGIHPTYANLITGFEAFRPGRITPQPAQHQRRNTMHISSMQSLDGGTGKTMFTIEQALADKAEGQRVLVIDTCPADTLLMDRLTSLGFQPTGAPATLFDPPTARDWNMTDPHPYMVVSLPRLEKEEWEKASSWDGADPMANICAHLAKASQYFDTCHIDVSWRDDRLMQIITGISDTVHYFPRLKPGSPVEVWKEKYWNQLPCSARPRISIESDRGEWHEDWVAELIEQTRAEVA